MCKGACVQQPVCRQIRRQISGAETVADTCQEGCVGEAGLERGEELLENWCYHLRRVGAKPRIQRLCAAAYIRVVLEEVHDDHRVVETRPESVCNQLGVDEPQSVDVREEEQELLGRLGVVFRDIALKATELLDLALWGALVEDDFSAARLWWKTGHSVWCVPSFPFLCRFFGASCTLHLTAVIVCVAKGRWREGGGLLIVENGGDNWGDLKRKLRGRSARRPSVRVDRRVLDARHPKEPFLAGAPPLAEKDKHAGRPAANSHSPARPAKQRGRGDTPIGRTAFRLCHGNWPARDDVTEQCGRTVVVLLLCRSVAILPLLWSHFVAEEAAVAQATASSASVLSQLFFQRSS